MFSEHFIKRISKQQYIDSEGLLKALEEPSPVSIRLNPSKWYKTPLYSTSVPWCNSGYYLNSRPSFTLDPLFHSGSYFPREASGMFLEEVFRQLISRDKDLRVLDLCGSPGGKSTQISDLIGESGLLVANEVIKPRAAILAETITKWGLSNTIVTQNDPSAFGRLEGYFDVIVIDAPCSGEGMFRTQVAVNEWSPENASHCSERQKRILSDVWPSLKENGLLIYSTCTFNPAENEENIKWMTGQAEAKCVRLDISGYKGISEIDYQGIYGYGFYPGRIKGEGFFISVIRKTGKQECVNMWSQKKKDLFPDKNDVAIAARYLNTSKEKLLKWGIELYAIPCNMDEYIFLFNNLNIIKGGTRIFVNKKDDYLPSHELALSGHLQKNTFPSVEVSLQEAIAYLRRDSLAPLDAGEGWNLLTYQYVNLGFIKNIGKRVNNYFPVEWRIRMDMPATGNENIIKWNFL